MTKTNEKKRPAFRGKLDRVQIAIWENKGKDGEPFYSISFSRSYSMPGKKDGETVWHQSSAFGERDLPSLSRGIEIAKDWLDRHQPEEVQVK